MDWIIAYQILRHSHAVKDRAVAWRQRQLPVDDLEGVGLRKFLDQIGRSSPYEFLDEFVDDRG